MIVLDFIAYLIFPGLLFGIWMSFTSIWMIRKLSARLENRVGPPFNQPIYDFAKLLAKERVYPHDSVIWILHYLPRFQAVIAMFMIFFIPIVGNEGLFSFDGDIYFFLFLLTLHGSTAFLIGWASRNPYTLSGAGRAIFTEISLEIPFAISLGGIAIMTGSLRISEITANLWNAFSPNESVINLLLIIPWLMLFNLTGILVAFFLGGPVVMLTEIPIASYAIGFLTFIVKFVLIIILLSFVVTLSSRLRIDQITHVLWSYFLPISMTAILLILSIKQGGTML